MGWHGHYLGGLYRYWLPDALDAQGLAVLNALASLNLFDADHGVSGRGQAHVVNCAAREAGEAQAPAGAKLLGVRPLCDGLDNPRPNGTAHSHDRLAG